MRIEDHWKDGTEFYVRFETKTHRFIEKVIVLPRGITREKAEDLIKKSFHNVERIVELDEGPDLLTYAGANVWQ
ncbi:hypothetical protein [Carnobacterium maltaromaticum]|uniref:hypothetical protein n=1 Tax=Carnobacterium maltaromaticum TaxID=2751 RepID=UPI000E72690D|nr:hypothetical protein [Carnobacterium maltaromaticum]AOA04138.1 hypothetical protein BFC23_16610 [Carnobacterium maltaromaticum]